jgi:hypothetical protein
MERSHAVCANGTEHYEHSMTCCILQVAYRDFDEPPEFTRTARDNKMESRLTFVSLIGMEDHIRPEVSTPFPSQEYDALKRTFRAYYL